MTVTNGATHEFRAARDFLPQAPCGLHPPRRTRASTGPARTPSTGRSTGSTSSHGATTAPPCTSSRRTASAPSSPSPPSPSVRTGWPTGCARGVRAEDRVLVMLGNQVELWETALAAMKLRAVVIPATTLLGPADLRHPARARPRPACDRARRGRREVRRGARSPHPDHGGERGPAGSRTRRRTPPTRASSPRASPTRTTPDALLHLRHHRPPRSSSSSTHPRPHPIGHLSTMYWIGLGARRRASEHLLARLGQARLVQPLRALERGGDRLHPQLHALRPGPADGGRTGRASPPSAPCPRSGGCSSRPT